MDWFGQISIRMRLTLAYSGAVCITLTILGLVTYFSIITNFEREVDKDLADRAAQARAYFSMAGLSSQGLEDFSRGYSITKSSKPSSPNKSAPMPQEPNELASALSYLQLVDADGQVVQRQPELKVMAKPATQEILATKLKEGLGYGYIRLYNGERARVLTVGLGRVENQGYIQVVRSLQEVDTIARGLITPLILLSLFAIGLLAAFGSWFTLRMFRPIENITTAAYNIKVDNDLTQRIATVPSSNDEASRLGRAFNGMLDRLEKSFNAQRQFIADSSHELRTPLTVISGNLDLLKRNPDPKGQASCLKAIENEGIRMQRLVKDLLLLAQADSRQTIRPVALQLEDLVLEVFLQTRVLADQRRQRLKLGNFEPAIVMGDADSLKRAFLNLIENAIKYTPDEGEIGVAIIRGNQWVRIEISDNGTGIDPQEQPLVFDRFFRTDKARGRGSKDGGGTGLGLSIVKHIIEAHGGQITLKSKLGEGTTFTVWLKTDASTPPNLDDGDDETDWPMSTMANSAKV